MSESNVPILPGVSFDVDIADPKERIQAWMDGYRPNEDEIPETFDSALMRDHLRLIRTDPDEARAIFELTVPQQFCSRTGMIHGGAAALIMDMCTSATQALKAKKGFWEFSGVSRSLSLTYLRPIPKSTDLVIDCQVLQMGKTLATVNGKIFTKRDNVLLCVAEHNKARVNIVERNAQL